MKPVVAYLRQRGHRLVIYLDDLPLMAAFKERMLSETQITFSFCRV
jgi:hypothetical protein